jgi:flagellar FliL protein
MPAAAAEPVDEAQAPALAKKLGRKKLMIVGAAMLLLLVAGGSGAAFVVNKKRAAAAAESAESEGGPALQAASHRKEERRKTPPVFLPLDSFVVNLADRDAERYAQIGITLELEDAKFTEEIKAYMPAIRNGVLLVLAHKTSQELHGRKGKEALAAEIMREAVRPLGIEIDEPAPDTAAARDGDPDPAPAAPAGGEVNPVRKVHFSSFIIQ